MSPASSQGLWGRELFERRWARGSWPARPTWRRRGLRARAHASAGRTRSRARAGTDHAAVRRRQVQRDGRRWRPGVRSMLAAHPRPGDQAPPDCGCMRLRRRGRPARRLALRCIPAARIAVRDAHHGTRTPIRPRGPPAARPCTARAPLRTGRSPGAHGTRWRRSTPGDRRGRRAHVSRARPRSPRCRAIGGSPRSRSAGSRGRSSPAPPARNGRPGRLAGGCRG